MIRVVSTAGLAVILASGLVATASAATLSDVSGRVMVDSGKGFVKVSANSEVPAGSRVLVSKGGQALLAYADGCSKTLGPNSVTTVVTSGACKPLTQVAGQAAGGGGGVNPWLLGGAGAVGGGLIGYAIGQSNSSDEVTFIPISR